MCTISDYLESLVKYINRWNTNGKLSRTAQAGTNVLLYCNYSIIVCSLISHIKTTPSIRTVELYRHELDCTRTNTLHWSVVVMVAVSIGILFVYRETFSETIKITTGNVCIVCTWHSVVNYYDNPTCHLVIIFCGVHL